MSGPLKLVTLCSGNVARSVMLGYMLTTLAEANGQAWSVRTAGTHVVEGSAMSAHTRDALLSLEDLGEHHYGAHRSHQLNLEDVEWADAILASESSNVLFVRTHYPDASDKAVTLQQFVREAPLDASFSEKVRVVASMTPFKDFDVDDPAGGTQAIYDACALKLWELAQVFAAIVDVEVD